MKLITLGKLFLLYVLYSSLILLINCEPKDTQASGQNPLNKNQDDQLIPIDTTLKALKYLFMYRYPLLKNNKNHKGIQMLFYLIQTIYLLNQLSA